MGVKMESFGNVSGLDDALKFLNSFPEDLLREMCHHVLLFLQYKISSLGTEQYRNKLLAAGLSSECNSVSMAVNAVCHVYRSCVISNWDEKSLRSKLTSIGCLEDTVIEVLTGCWKEQQSMVATDALKSLLSIGKLVDVDWKASLATGSSSCRGLHAVFVTISLRVMDPSGSIATNSFVLSMKEFKEFSSQIKEMTATLEAA